MNKSKIAELSWMFFLIVLFVFSLKLTKSGELASVLSSFGFFAPIALVFLKASTLIIAPLGGSPLYVIAGALFGTKLGLVIVLLGDILGSLVCFLLGRRFGERVVGYLAGDKYIREIKKITGLLDSTKGFMKARLALITIPELLAYAAGLSTINVAKFMLLHSIVYVPVDIIFVFLGEKVASTSSLYLFVVYGIVFLLALSGFASLYKDYHRVDNSE